MKSIYFLLVLFLTSSNDLFSQKDSLLVSDSSERIQKDPINPPIITLSIDTSYFKDYPWGYPPPCIVPPKWDIRSMSSLIWITPNIHYVFSHDAEAAKNAIKGGRPLILFSAGNGIVSSFNSKKDKAFQSKYQIEFLSQEYFHDGADEKAYNQVIFDYLDQKFGNKWRFELREDAIGFEAPELVFPKLGEIAIQIANSANPLKQESMNLDPETSIWWYVLPTSGFALLLALYFIKRKKD